MIVTDEMVLAAARTLIRYTLAERDRVKPEAVTEEEIDDELAEIRQLEAESPELPGVDEVFAEVLTAALDVSGGAVTREPSDIWQAVMVDQRDFVVDASTVDDHVAVSVYVVRRSSLPVDGHLPSDYETTDVAHWVSPVPGCGESAARWTQAQAMAAGLNAAEATR